MTCNHFRDVHARHRVCACIFALVNVCVCVCVRVCVRQVTALLEQVDANVCKATDSAAELLTSVRTFVAHTKNVNSACTIWMSFFRAFEDEERKRSLSERSLAQSDDTPNLTNELLPSFCGSPRTPSLEDSGPCKRRYEATPDCGASPLRSVKFKDTKNSAVRVGGVAGTEPAVDAAEAGPQEGEDSFSPVSQPNFGLLNLPIPGNMKTECSIFDARLAARCVSPMDPCWAIPMLVWCQSFFTSCLLVRGGEAYM